jgi:hypothetical protein
MLQPGTVQALRQARPGEIRHQASVMRWPASLTAPAGSCAYESRHREPLTHGTTPRECGATPAVQRN